MKFFRIFVLLGFSFSLAQGYAAESTFNYDYVEVGSVSLDTQIVGVDIDGDTLGVSGSFDLSESINFLASYQSTDFDFDLEGTQSTIGLGYHEGAARGTDLYLEAFYLAVELAFPEGVALEDVDETGYGLNIGIRNLIGTRVEIDSGFSHVDLGGGSQTGFGISGRYYFNRTFALGLSFSSVDDTHGFGFGLRVGL